MGKLLKTDSLVIFAPIFFFIPLSAIGDEKKMTIDYPEFYPFFAQTENREIEGFFYDIIMQNEGILEKIISKYH